MLIGPLNGEARPLAEGALPAAPFKEVLGDEPEEPPSTRVAVCSGRHAPRFSAFRPSSAARSAPRFPINPDTAGFRRRFYPNVSAADWNDWRWQLRSRIRTAAELARLFVLTADEQTAVDQHEGPLPVGITPYYASLMGRDDPSEPLRRTHIPTSGEYLRLPGDEDDPLGEDGHTVVPGLVHRYPDRVLFLTTGFCSTYCRYCTRSRMVGANGEYTFNQSQWERALGYIESTPAVRDVLLSGGDPLTLSEEKLDWLLGRLRAIPHVEFVRIGTKVPVVLPMRVTRDLVRVLKRHKPWLSIHFTHPNELTAENAEACSRLADAGLPLGSQTVLLAGINDSVDTMKRLVHGLLRQRVRPYYLYQCDPIRGSHHFRSSVDKGLEIIAGLRGHTTGYGVPHFVIDAPGGGGKIPLLPAYVVGRDGSDLVLRNFEGGLFRYPDTGGAAGTVGAGGSVHGERTS